MKILFSIFLIFYPFIICGGNTNIDSFEDAKKLLLKRVYYDHMVTFYCDCQFEVDKSIPKSNKFKPARKYFKRSKRIEWEHVVPAESFGKSFKEWRDGDSRCINKKGKTFKNRKCAEKVNSEYRYMQADMYNLVPAIGQINALRSNYRYAMIPGEKREFGSCDIEIENRKAEPRPDIRGDIARIYFYMNDAYPNRGILTKKNRKLFEIWSKQDPVDEWERERARRIEKIQGNRNKYVN